LAGAQILAKKWLGLAVAALIEIDGSEIVDRRERIGVSVPLNASPRFKLFRD
jgi:hypothetical protein